MAVDMSSDTRPVPTVRSATGSMRGGATLAGSGATMRQVVIKAGHVSARHHHDHEQFLFIASGGGQLECAAGEIALEPGTMLQLEAGAWHSAVFTRETVLIEINLRD